MKTNYSYREYANHAYRLYARTVGTMLPTSSATLPDPVELRNMLAKPLSTADMMKLSACHEALSSFTCIQAECILSVYRYKGIFADAIKLASKKYDMPVRAVWRLLHKATEKFAEVRGLI